MHLFIRRVWKSSQNIQFFHSLRCIALRTYLFTGQKTGEDEEMIDVEGYEDEDSMLRSIVNSQTDRPFADLSQNQSSFQGNDDSLAEPPSETLDSILLQDLQHSDSDDSEDDDDFPFGDGEDEEEEEEESQDMFDFSGNADDSMDAMETNDADQKQSDASNDDSNQ